MGRKGQWFIVGAITLMTMMVLVATSRTQIQMGSVVEPWQKYIFNNLKDESPGAINSIISTDASSENVEEGSKEYLDFLRSFGNSRGIDVSAYFIIGLPANAGINISVINFWGSELQDITITLNGTAQEISSLADRGSATVAFLSVPDYFAVNYALTERNATGAGEAESGEFATTKRVFSAVKLRIKSKDGNQIWQRVEWN